MNWCEIRFLTSVVDVEKAKDLYWQAFRDCPECSYAATWRVISVNRNESKWLCLKQSRNQCPPKHVSEVNGLSLFVNQRCVCWV